MDHDQMRAAIHRQMAMTMELAEETMRQRETPWWQLPAIMLMAIGVGLVIGWLL